MSRAKSGDCRVLEQEVEHHRHLSEPARPRFRSHLHLPTCPAEAQRAQQRAGTINGRLLARGNDNGYNALDWYSKGGILQPLKLVQGRYVFKVAHWEFHVLGCQREPPTFEGTSCELAEISLTLPRTHQNGLLPSAPQTSSQLLPRYPTTKLPSSNYLPLVPPLFCYTDFPLRRLHHGGP